MYAVFEDGSRQYRVSEGDLVAVDYRDVEKGTRLEFNKVLLYTNGNDTQIGRPLLEGARVVGDVVDFPSVKTYMQKYRRRKNYRRAKGHRQYHTQIRVSHILLAGQETPAAPPPPAPKNTETPAPTPTT